MMMMWKGLLALFIAVMLATTVQAVPVTPGGNVALSGTTVAARPELAGVVVEDVLRPFTINDASGLVATGQVQDRVIRETASGTLTFSYRIINDVSSAGPIVYFYPRSFTGFATDVDFRLDGLGTVGPSAA